MKTGQCYWRLKGEKIYKYGYATPVGGGLYRMGLWHGDSFNGPIVDPNDIEIREFD